MEKGYCLAGTVVAGVGAGAALYALRVRPWHRRWGATEEEVTDVLPGDEFVRSPKDVSTHAITIDAPVGDVWPWLAQIGQGRRLQQLHPAGKPGRLPYAQRGPRSPGVPGDPGR